jgi:hypothetical protein
VRQTNDKIWSGSCMEVILRPEQWSLGCVVNEVLSHDNSKFYEPLRTWATKILWLGRNDLCYSWARVLIGMNWDGKAAWEAGSNNLELGNHFSICLKAERSQQNVCRVAGRRAFRVLVDKPTVPKPFKTLPKFYAAQSLLPCSEVLAISPYLYPDESSPFPILFL